MASNENHKGVIVINSTAISPFCFSNRFYVGVLLITCIAPMVSSQTPHWLKGGLIKVKTSDIMRIIFCFLSNMVKSCIDHSSINVSLGKTFSMILFQIFLVLKGYVILLLRTLTRWYRCWEITTFLADRWSISDQVIPSITLECTGCIIVYLWFRNAVCLRAR